MSIFDKYDLVDVDETFPIPSIPNEGLILITGTSGSGKSTILRSVFGCIDTIKFDSKPLYKNFSSENSAENCLLACGLRTIPSWKRPYANLSNGEQHRAYCAKCIDCGIEYIDEFSSVVDRDTAKALSYSIQKWFRSSGQKRLILASCHSDIIEWLNPDYVYNTDLRKWNSKESCGRLLRRPQINLKIEAVDGKMFWPIFKKHHYLSSGFNKSANAFVGYIGSKPVAFCSILRFPNANFNNGWREHRTVVIPEFQGLGIGIAISECIAEMVLDAGGRFFSKTSHPSFGEHRNKSNRWKPTSKNGKNRLDYKEGQNTKEDGHKMKHRFRMCYSHEYVGEIGG